MEFIEMKLPGLFLIKPKRFSDTRGGFVKTFHKGTFSNMGLNCDFEESYYSISHKDVIRGMHFQVPPHDHEKLVYVSNGKVLDVVLDIRTGSPSYGQFASLELDAENAHMLYIPKGCAHGFLSLENYTQVNFLQTSMYDSTQYEGIRYDSFGFQWNVPNPNMSKQDKSLISLQDFVSPFKYNY